MQSTLNTSLQCKKASQVTPSTHQSYHNHHIRQLKYLSVPNVEARAEACGKGGGGLREEMLALKRRW
jgi:hypothetical protein